MYWSEWETRTIYKADKFSGANTTALTGSLVGRAGRTVVVVLPLLPRVSCPWWCRSTTHSSSPTTRTSASPHHAPTSVSRLQGKTEPKVIVHQLALPQAAPFRALHLLRLSRWLAAEG